MAIHSSVCGNHYYTVRKECKTCTFYHVSVHFYLAREADDDDRRKKKSKSEGRQRQTRKEDDRYGYTTAQKLKIVLVAYRTCHRRRQIDGIKRKKTEDSKRHRLNHKPHQHGNLSTNKQPFGEWLIFHMNLVIDLPELSESYECTHHTHGHAAICNDTMHFSTTLLAACTST